MQYEFTINDLSTKTLHEEIDAGQLPGFQGLDVKDDLVCMLFESELSEEDFAVLNGIVSAHSGGSTNSEFIVSGTIDGLPVTASVPYLDLK